MITSNLKGTIAILLVAILTSCGTGTKQEAAGSVEGATKEQPDSSQQTTEETPQDSEKAVGCSCSDPSGNEGDYNCKNGKRYRCRNNVHNVCEWQETAESC
jgi:hypothetical protein